MYMNDGNASSSSVYAESIRSLCLSTYLPEEVMKLNDIAEMRAGATLGKALQSEYLTVSGTCFINQSSPVMTVSKNEIRFSKACHTRLDNCEYVELLYHPILQVVILRKRDQGSSTAMRWQDDNNVHPNKKRLALIMCPEEDSASVEWARQKDENWVNKDITSLEFVENIFRLISFR